MQAQCQLLVYFTNLTSYTPTLLYKLLDQSTNMLCLWGILVNLIWTFQVG